LYTQRGCSTPCEPVLRTESARRRPWVSRPCTTGMSRQVVFRSSRALGSVRLYWTTFQTRQDSYTLRPLHNRSRIPRTSSPTGLQIAKLGKGGSSARLACRDTMGTSAISAETCLQKNVILPSTLSKLHRVCPVEDTTVPFILESVRDRDLQLPREHCQARMSSSGVVCDCAI